MPPSAGALQALEALTLRLQPSPMPVKYLSCPGQLLTNSHADRNLRTTVVVLYGFVFYAVFYDRKAPKILDELKIIQTNTELFIRNYLKIWTR